MKKISNLLGKPVLSLYESRTEGFVKNVVFDKGLKKLKWIIFFEDNEFQEEKIVSTASIYSFGENAIIVKNEDSINLKEEIILELNNPINNPVYTTKGKFLGNVADVVLNDKLFVENLILDNSLSISNNQIAVSSPNTLIVQDEEKTIRISNFKKRGMPNKNSAISTQEVKILPKVEIQSTIIDMADKTTEQPATKYTFGNNSLPLHLSSSNCQFLIGRKAEKNIYADNRELIIKKNTKITKKTVESAKSYGKLRELTMFSL